MRISDWSSDVCSSDLLLLQARVRHQLGDPLHGLDQFALRVRLGRHRLERLDLGLGHLARHALAQRGEYLAARRGFTVLIRRSEEHTSELQSLMRISYAVFCLKKKKKTNK